MCVSVRKNLKVQASRLVGGRGIKYLRAPPKVRSFGSVRIERHPPEERGRHRVFFCFIFVHVAVLCLVLKRRVPSEEAKSIGIFGQLFWGGVATMLALRPARRQLKEPGAAAARY